MNASPDFLTCLRLLAWLALELVMLVAIAGALSRLTVAAPWRRIIWQGCLVSLIALTLAELSGVGRELATSVRHALASTRREDSRGVSPARSLARYGNLILSSAPTTTVPEMITVISSPVTGKELTSSNVRSDRSAAGMMSKLELKSAPARNYTPALDAVSLILVWMAGAAWFLVRAMVARLICLNLGRRHRHDSGDLAAGSIDVLAGKLGIRRHVRLIESARLRSPVAFGWWRPSIGIPAGLPARFSRVQQEAMLSHELAHLAGRDPFWYGLADFAAAVLWWHPFVWLARRRLRDASERAADEASRLISDGPQALAECLVELGLQLTGRPGAGAPGFEGTGFRSGLAQRVERLHRMRDGSWQPPGSIRSLLARTIAPAILVATIVVGTGWTQPQTINQEDSMKTIHNLWTQSISALALLAATEPVVAAPASLTSLTEPSVALTSEKRLAQATATPRPAGVENPSQPEATAGYPSYGMDPALMERYGLIPKGARASTGATPASSRKSNESIGLLQSQLDQMVFDEVRFESLPLSEVLKFLSTESRKRETKTGVNFLINPNPLPDPNPAVSIDPTTGVPLTQSEPMDMSGVIVNFNLPLRNVRLTDVLNAIVKVADKPIQFSIEEYGVVFSPAPGRNQAVGMSLSTARLVTPLSVRTFRVDTNTFLAGLESTFGISPATPAAADRSARSRDVQGALRKLMLQLGVNMDDPLKAVFYNDLTGVLMVRATPGDLELVEAAVETLGGTAGSRQMSEAGSGGMGSAAETAGPYLMNKELMRRYGLLPANSANSNNLK